MISDIEGGGYFLSVILFFFFFGSFSLLLPSYTTTRRRLFLPFWTPRADLPKEAILVLCDSAK